MRRREVTVTPQGDRVPLQPTQGEQRQGNRGHLPPYILRNSNKQFTGSEAPDLPSLPPEAALQGEKAGGRRRRGRRAYNPLSQTWRFHLVAFCINFHQDYTVRWFDTFLNCIGP